MGTDWIDLYQIRRPDPNTDIDETLGALTDLVHQGKIRYFGHSTFPASEITEAQWTAERRGRERFRCEQPPYSILVRAIEHDVLPACERYGIGVIAYSPLAGGWLSGRYRKNAASEGPTSSARPAARFDISDPANQRKLEAVERLAQLADETGIPLVQMAIAFVLRHPAVTAAIVGPRTLEHLESQLAGGRVTQMVEHLRTLLDRVTVLPAVNQIEVHPYFAQQHLQVMLLWGACSTGAQSFRSPPSPSGSQRTSACSTLSCPPTRWPRSTAWTPAGAAARSRRSHLGGLWSRDPGHAQQTDRYRGETLVVWWLDRHGRGLKHLIDAIGRLETRSAPTEGSAAGADIE